MPFAYYRRLNAAQKRTYRQSDAVRSIPLGDLTTLRALVEQLGVALETGKQRSVGQASRALVHAMCDQLEISRTKVVVHRQRPRNDWGELHGFYTLEPGKTPQIELWMRTAANARIVAFKTFLRTLVHEVGHHIDLMHLHLDDTFHTEGFLARESSIVRQLLPRATDESTPKKRAQRQGPRSVKSDSPWLFDPNAQPRGSACAGAASRTRRASATAVGAARSVRSQVVTGRVSDVDARIHEDYS